MIRRFDPRSASDRELEDMARERHNGGAIATALVILGLIALACLATGPRHDEAVTAQRIEAR